MRQEQCFKKLAEGETKMSTAVASAEGNRGNIVVRYGVPLWM